MIMNRELTVDDFIAICRRRFFLVLIPGLIAALLGFAISFALTPKYSSRALLQVEAQVVPSNYVKPIVTEGVNQRMAVLLEKVLSRARLQPLVTRLALARSGKNVDDVIDEIRQNLTIKEADPIAKPSGTRPGASTQSDVSGFYLVFTMGNPHDAQQVCSGITSMLLEENLELREAVAQSTTDFLSLQLEQAKHNLDDLDDKLALFKQAHLGRLPSDIDSNLRILTGLDAQLDANAQGIDRAQEDKAYAQSKLEQELTVWKSALASPTIPSLRQELISLQDRLITLQARYTDDFPEVIKTKREIAQVKKQVDTLTAKTDQEPSSEDLGHRLEPPEIQRLRDQIHHDEGHIEHATAQQSKLKEQIDLYQSRLSVSPEVEEQYKQLTRDSTTAHNMYNDLLANKTTAEIQTEMERKQQGEQLTLLDPASLPSSPSFPIRWQFALYGLGAGLGLGVSAAGWLEIRDRRLHDEKDVLAALELPTLASVSWANGKEPEPSKRVVNF